MQQTIVYITSSLDQIYECAYSILKYLDVYNLKPPTDHKLVIFTNHPELLEVYGTFFNEFELRPIPPNEDRESILQQVKASSTGPVHFLESNTYPVKKLETNASGTVADGAIQCYNDLREFRILLKDFFGRYQEESVPNQVKLLHNIDAKKIEEHKKQFERLPLTSRWFKKLMGKGWSINNYQRKI
jgi:hypothetical protein